MLHTPHKNKKIFQVEELQEEENNKKKWHSSMRDDIQHKRIQGTHEIERQDCLFFFLTIFFLPT
ncbi:MAG: hypothetical protein COW26_00135 [Nitrosopumilales archaeon CG15_BIG_FIL_POST_REV_8_21_14_020_33_23]|nr:MAG: hypothetical protein COW26_00135 [Nitrosopumilales archaeon CG15_BIG_FIL_POST_REV_8_21_14_020_33_23]